MQIYVVEHGTIDAQHLRHPDLRRDGHCDVCTLASTRPRPHTQSRFIIIYTPDALFGFSILNLYRLLNEDWYVYSLTVNVIQ
jgi:hypothetical protein